MLPNINILNDISIGSAIFEELTLESPCTLQWADPFLCQNCPFPWRNLDPTEQVVSPAYTRVHKPRSKRHLGRFSGFCRVHDRDRPTDQATPSLTTGRIYVRTVAMRTVKLANILAYLPWNTVNH